MRLLPAPDAVVVRPVQQAEKTGAGIFIPQESQKLLDEAIIIEVGRDLVDRYKVDDRIVYSRYSGDFLKFSPDGVGALGDAEEVIILEADDIRAIVVADDDPRLGATPA